MHRAPFRIKPSLGSGSTGFSLSAPSSHSCESINGMVSQSSPLQSLQYRRFTGHGALVLVDQKNDGLRWVLIAGAISVAVASFVVGWPFRIHPGVNQRRMAMIVDAEISRGADVQKVIAFLDSHEIEHSSYLRNERQILAIKRHVCWVLLLECSIDMKFFFDQDNRLQDRSIEEGFTGL